jgi:hypothetical protein
MRVKPGLSFFSDNPAEAGTSLGALLDFATSRVPESK